MHPFELDVLTAVKQSILIHPEWNETDHRDYILSETCNSDIDIEQVSPGTYPHRTHACDYPPGCTDAAVSGGKLCFHHLVNVGRLFAPASGRW